MAAGSRSGTGGEAEGQGRLATRAHPSCDYGVMIARWSLWGECRTARPGGHWPQVRSPLRARAHVTSQHAVPPKGERTLVRLWKADPLPSIQGGVFWTTQNSAQPRVTTAQPPNSQYRDWRLHLVVPGYEDSTLGNIFAAYVRTGACNSAIAKSGIEWQRFMISTVRSRSMG
jgi:hypothetical protein